LPDHRDPPSEDYLFFAFHLNPAAEGGICSLSNQEFEGVTGIVYRFVNVTVTRRAHNTDSAADRRTDTVLWGYRDGETLRLVSNEREIPATASVWRSFATVGELVFAAHDYPVVVTLSGVRIQGASFSLHDGSSEFRRVRDRQMRVERN
jgi:hypothetical protein